MCSSDPECLGVGGGVNSWWLGSLGLNFPGHNTGPDLSQKLPLWLSGTIPHCAEETKGGQRRQGLWTHPLYIPPSRMLGTISVLELQGPTYSHLNI